MVFRCLKLLLLDFVDCHFFGGFKHVLFSPRSLGKWSNLTSIFFRWVGKQPPTRKQHHTNPCDFTGAAWRSNVFWQHGLTRFRWIPMSFQHRFYGRSGRCHVKQVNDTLGEFSNCYGFTWLNHFCQKKNVKNHRRLRSSLDSWHQCKKNKNHQSQSQSPMFFVFFFFRGFFPHFEVGLPSMDGRKLRWDLRCDLLWSDPDDRCGWGISPRGQQFFQVEFQLFFLNACYVNLRN